MEPRHDASSSKLEALASSTLTQRVSDAKRDRRPHFLVRVRLLLFESTCSSVRCPLLYLPCLLVPLARDQHQRHQQKQTGRTVARNRLTRHDHSDSTKLGNETGLARRHARGLASPSEARARTPTSPATPPATLPARLSGSPSPPTYPAHSILLSRAVSSLLLLRVLLGGSSLSSRPFRADDTPIQRP